MYQAETMWVVLRFMLVLLVIGMVGEFLTSNDNEETECPKIEVSK